MPRQRPQISNAQTARHWSRHEYRTFTSLTLPDGRVFHPLISLETHREDCALDLIYQVIESDARAPDGSTIARCSFYTCRRPRNQPSLAADRIADAMDEISWSVSRMGCFLLEDAPHALEHCVNRSVLVVADRVVVEPCFRGTFLWRDLFALCVRHALYPCVPAPDCGYLHAFPLDFEGRVEGNEIAFGRATQRLERLYGAVLGANVLAATESAGSYMDFPITC